MWCEHCRDHYSEDHYPDGRHSVGAEFGPTGYSLALDELVHEHIKAKLKQSSIDWADSAFISAVRLLDEKAGRAE